MPREHDLSTEVELYDDTLQDGWKHRYTYLKFILANMRRMSIQMKNKSLLGPCKTKMKINFS